MKIKDSGNRREFETGAVRDIQEGKGRCDLMPLHTVGSAIFGWSSSNILSKIDSFQRNMQDEEMKVWQKVVPLYDVLADVIRTHEYGVYSCNCDVVTVASGDTTVAYSKRKLRNAADVMLELAVHFEAGAKKYGERNWEKGIPVSAYIDSAVRHYLKSLRCDTDENHMIAFIWNIVCCIHTVEDMIEVPNEEVKGV